MHLSNQPLTKVCHKAIAVSLLVTLYRIEDNNRINFYGRQDDALRAVFNENFTELII